MNRWTMSAILILTAALVGCSNNNAKAGIVITAASTTTGANSVTVPVNGTEQFGATVTGVSDTTVYWQVCLPSNVSTVLPTTCTTIPGVTFPKGDIVLTGYGTINQNGFYTAPSQIPSNNFVILATSPVDTTAFATFGVVIDSGIRVQVTPVNSTIDAGDTVQFTATVTGSANTAVTWEVNGMAGGDPNNGGTITTSGFFTSQVNGSGAVSVKAVSGADGTTSGAATVSILDTAPAISAMEPEITEQGAAMQEVYLTGTNFTTDGTVLVNNTPVTPVFLSPSLLRVPIPGSLLASAGTIPIEFQLQSGEVSHPQSLTVIPVRPSIVAYTPQSVSSSGSAATINLTGGFFSQGTPATTVQFDNGNEGPVAITVNSNPQLASRQMSVALPAGAVSVPGLYPLTVQNPGVASGQASMSGVNIAVTPASIAAAPGPTAPISLGATTQPSAIAMDLADGVAVVTEQGANSVALISLATDSVTQTIPVGSMPTGVAVDDLLPQHLALVVNSADNQGAGSVTVINLSASPAAVEKTISLAGFTPSMSSPVSIAINPQTHRAFVANSSTNLGTVLDLVNTNPNIDPACTTAPCPLVTVGGNLTGYSTGANPAIGIDPGLNWAIVTPGGAGVIDIVDLGFGSLSAGSDGRAPAVIGSLAISTTIQGVGVNPETHTALFTDFNTGAVTTFNMLSNAVNSVTLNGVALNVQKEIAAAVNPLQNIGVAINSDGSGTASIIDMGNHVVLQTVNSVTSAAGTPVGVAVDPATNEALIADSGAGTVSIVSLGASSAKSLQILESSPEMSLTSTSPLSLTITGTGFTGGSNVLLDGTALPAGDVTYLSSRQILATVPASLLTTARHFAVQVENGSAVSNVEPLIVVQSVGVGTSPAGVAIDRDRELAVVTNSGTDDISLVSLAPPSLSPQSLGPIGTVGPTLPAHLDPRGVAVDPRNGLAVAANYDSNDLSLVDYSEVNIATPYSLPAVKGCAATSVCTGPSGIAFNEDTNNFLVTDSNIGTATSDVAFGETSPATVGSQASITSPVTPQPVDQTPGDLAIAPSFDPFDPINNPNPTLTYAAIASASQTSVIDFLNTQSEVVVGRTTGVTQPTGVVYDSLNRVFLVSDSLNDNIVIVDPLTFIPVFVRGGFNPSSIAYNPQTSTIVAVNGATGTLSILDYLCPPLTSTPACTSPQVRTTLGLVGSQISSAAPLGPKTVDIDPLLNIAVLVDSENNRVLLIPLAN